MISLVTINGTTDGSGDATIDTASAVLGELLAVFVEGIALTDSANLVCTTRMPLVAGTEATGETLVNHADVGNATMNTLYPRRAAQDVAETDLVYALSDVVPVPFVIPGAHIRAVISAGGDTKSFRITYVIRG